MGGDSATRKRARLKTYSRLINSKVELSPNKGNIKEACSLDITHSAENLNPFKIDALADPNSKNSTTKKRPLEDILITAPALPVKKLKRSSILQYFPSLKDSSSPASTSSYYTSDASQPKSTPPSSPPSSAGRSSHTQTRKSPQRTRRRLKTRVVLGSLDRMSSPSPCHEIGEAHSLNEALGPMQGSPQVTLGEEYLDREERRDEDFSASNQRLGGTSDSQLLASPSSMSAPAATVLSPQDHPATAPFDIPPRKPKPKIKKVGYTQLQLEMGQKKTILCKECNMAYYSNIEEDRLLHDEYHMQSQSIRPMRRSSTFDVMSRLDVDGACHKIQAVDCSVSSRWRTIFENALNTTYKDFGGLQLNSRELWSKIRNPNDEEDLTPVPRYKLYLYIVGVEVVGVLLAERIAYAVINGPKVERRDAEGSVYDCWMSVDRLWVSSDYRRKGIATSLVDNARETFITGLDIQKKEIAFSGTTDLGTKFAERYQQKQFPNGMHLLNWGDFSTRPLIV